MLNNVNLIIHFCLNYYIMMCVGFTCIISTSATFSPKFKWRVLSAESRCSSKIGKSSDFGRVP